MNVSAALEVLVIDFNIVSIRLNKSKVFLVPENVRVVLIVNFTTSSTDLIVILVFLLSDASTNNRISVMLLPKRASLFTASLIIIESVNSLFARNKRDDESGNEVVSEGALFDMNNLDIVSIDDDVSVVDLEPVNNLVVSMVTRIISEGFLFARNNLDNESVVVDDVSEGCLIPRNNLDVVSVKYKISARDLVFNKIEDNESIMFMLSVTLLEPVNNLVVSIVTRIMSLTDSAKTPAFL